VVATGLAGTISPAAFFTPNITGWQASAAVCAGHTAGLLIQLPSQHLIMLAPHAGIGSQYCTPLWSWVGSGVQMPEPQAT